MGHVETGDGVAAGVGDRGQIEIAASGGGALEDQAWALYHGLGHGVESHQTSNSKRRETLGVCFLFFLRRQMF